MNIVIPINQIDINIRTAIVFILFIYETSPNGSSTLALGSVNQTGPSLAM